MGSFLKRRQRWSWQLWFACLAILLNALTPALSYAFAAHHANTVASEICWSSGAVLTQAEQAELAFGGAPSDAIDHHVKHCPFCISHAGSAGLPPVTAPLQVVGGHDVYPPLFYRSPQALYTWLQAQPRGPPLAA